MPFIRFDGYPGGPYDNSKTSGMIEIWQVKLSRTRTLRVSFVKGFDVLSGVFIKKRRDGTRFARAIVREGWQPSWGDDLNRLEWGYSLRNIAVVEWRSLLDQDDAAEFVTLETEDYSELMQHPGNVRLRAAETAPNH